MSGSRTLADIVARPPVRERVVADCVALVDGEVKAKGGISGIAIKGAYSTVKTIKPRFVPEVVDALLDDWVGKLEPYFARWQSGGGGSFAEHLTARSEDVAEDLLSVTDARAASSKHKTASKLYDKMRPSAKKNVAAAIPKLGALMEKHVGEAQTSAEPPEQAG
jgi:hypothetical protein